MSFEHPSHVVKKRTIIKDRVGCTRTTTYDLPNDNFVYGKKTEDTGETAEGIISNWVTTNPSLEKEAPKLIVYSNVLAVKRGCITAKSMRQYAIDHPNIRMKEILNSDNTRLEANHEGPFGIKTSSNEETMGELLQAKYTDFTSEDTDYPSVASIKKTGFMPVPKTTHAAELIAETRRKAQEKTEKPHFTMKKFQKVKGTFEREREEAKETKRKFLEDAKATD
eukprot:gene5155-5523_t